MWRALWGSLAPEIVSEAQRNSGSLPGIREEARLSAHRPKPSAKQAKATTAQCKTIIFRTPGRPQKTLLAARDGSGRDLSLWRWQANEVPWCEPCERFWNPSSVTEMGECPTCGTLVETASDVDSTARQRVPWHFWLAITAAGVYLAWRAIDGIALLF